MKIPGSIISSLLPLLAAIMPLIAGCGRDDYMRPDERWPDRPEVAVAADSALGEALHGISMGIDNSDSTLKLAVTFMAPEQIGSMNPAGRFGVLLYGTIGDSAGVLPAALTAADVAAGSPVLLAGDPLVLLVAANSGLASPVDLADPRITAIATVAQQQPEGKLAELALRRLGLRDTLSGRLRTARSGRDLLDMITSGRGTVGIINGSQARRFEGRTTIIDTLRLPPAGSGTGTLPMIRYHALMLRSARDSGAAARMMAWLVSPEFQRSFNHNGFLRRDSILAREQHR